MKSHIIHHCLEFEYFPHEKVDIKKINWGEHSGAWIARWTTDFDCNQETQFWYVIKDTPFNIDELKAKRRYEINKGNRNFYTNVIDPLKYKEALYSVYCESLGGYADKRKPISQEQFEKQINAWASPEAVIFGTFSRDNDQLCGYADVYKRYPYLPISSIKTIPAMGREGVNFALICGILSYFDKELREGCYLCDGSRVLVHKTHFQDFLEKYFAFRKAYCVLNTRYRFPISILIKVGFPFRRMIYLMCDKKILPNGIRHLFMMEAWNKGEEK